MSIAEAFDMSRKQRSNFMKVRKGRIRGRLAVNRVSKVEEGPSLAGWAAYVASALAFLMLCVMATFK
jgi:hypothetical protein